MRKITLGILVFSLFICPAASALADSQPGIDHQQTGYAPGRLLVQLTNQALDRVDAVLSTQNNGKIITGLTSLDVLNRKHQVQRIFKLHKNLKSKNLSKQLGSNRWFIVQVPMSADIEALSADYSVNEHVQVAKPDWLLFRTAVPNDKLYELQWGHNNTAQMLSYCWKCGGHEAGSPVGVPGFDADAETAWDLSQKYGDEKVVVAIIDSGVELSHPDLNLVDGYDYGDDDDNPNDDSDKPGHGTACAGVAAAIADNNLGVAGIAGGCKIMPLKIANQEGSMKTSSLAQALHHAADNGAHIASMSLGANITSDPLVDPALQYANEAGVTLFAASGNSNTDSVLYPANSSFVVAVGAASPCGDRKRSSSDPLEVNPGVNTDPNGFTCDGERWWGSSYGGNVQDDGDSIDFLAPTILPTTDITSTAGYDEEDYFKWFNGTSCATPYAAGVAALLKSKNSEWTPAQIRARIATTATDVQNVESDAGWDRYSGYGLVNAGAALNDSENIPPVAKANGPYTGEVDVDIAFSSTGSEDADGQIASYWWEFGDGSSSEDANPTYKYSKGGTFTVILTVTDDQGATTSDKTTAEVGGGETYITKESEKNDGFSEADGPVGIDIAVGGKIKRRDKDVFYIDVAETGAIEISLDILKGRGHGKFDLDWFLYDENLNEVARGYTKYNPEAGSYVVEQAGRYYLEVDGYRHAKAPYKLTISKPASGNGPSTEHPVVSNDSSVHEEKKD